MPTVFCDLCCHFRDADPLYMTHSSQPWSWPWEQSSPKYLECVNQGTDDLTRSIWSFICRRLEILALELWRACVLEGSCTSANKIALRSTGCSAFIGTHRQAWSPPSRPMPLKHRKAPHSPLECNPHWDLAAVVKITLRFNIYGACPYWNWGWRSLVQPCKSVFLCGNLLRLGISVPRSAGDELNVARTGG